VRAALAGLAARAERAAARGAPAERPAACLLAETARAIDAALATVAPGEPAGPDPAPHPALGPGRGGAGGALASPLRLRLARMERWLAARAAADPGAEASANLCLWVLEHLEAEAEW
jgi:hypothetical protein